MSCIICHLKKPIVKHHIDSNRNNDALNNLIELCPNHHWAAHHSGFSLKERKIFQKITGFDPFQIQVENEAGLALRKRIAEKRHNGHKSIIRADSAVHISKDKLDLLGWQIGDWVAVIPTPTVLPRKSRSHEATQLVLNNLSK